MAVQKFFEILEGRISSGDRESGVSYTRVFSVWTTTPDTKLSEVVASSGVKFGDQHPDDPTAIASSFDCAQTDSLLRYHVSITYITCTTLQSDGTCAEGLPEISWTGSTAVQQRPIYKDAEGNLITNAAREPIPNIQADSATMTLSCVKYYATCEELFIALGKFTNKVNSVEWAGFGINWWKCQGASWSPERMNVCGESELVYQSTWSFQLDGLAWVKEYLNVGFQELTQTPGPTVVYSIANIIDGKTQAPVTVPQSLTDEGVWAPGTLPTICKDITGRTGFTVYNQEEFGPEFGDPCTALPSTPCPPPTIGGG